MISTDYANQVQAVEAQTPVSFVSRLQHAVTYAASRVFSAISQRMFTYTPNDTLFVAAFEGSVVKAQAAINANADITATNSAGKTALYMALYGYDSPRDALAALLMQQGAGTSGLGDSASLFIFAVQKGAWKFAEALLERGVKINEKNISGCTALHVGAKAGDFKMVKGLLGLGADASLADVNGMTPLHYAALKGHRQVVEVLLRASKNPDPKDDQNRSPLHWAATKGHVDVARLLVKAKANLELLDRKKQSALALATAEGAMLEERLEIAKLLLESGASLAPLLEFEDPLTLLFRAAVVENKDLIKLYFKKGLDNRIVDPAGRTLLHRAVVKHPDCGMIRKMLECGFSAKSSDQTGATPLHDVTAVEDAKALLDHHADIEAKNNASETPIFEVVRKKSMPLFELLYARGANVYRINKKQKSLVHIAKRHELRHTELSKQIKKAIHLKPDVMKQISGTLQQVIHKARNAAHAQKKQLLIILGETHGEYRGFLVEKLALKVAHALGINKALVEEPFSHTRSMREERRDSYFPINCAKKLGMEVIGVDNNRTEIAHIDISPEGMRRRNAGIKEFTERVQGDKLLVTGSAHLIGLMDDPATKINRKTHYIVPIRLTYQEDYYDVPGQFIQLTQNGFDRKTADALVKKWNS